MHRRTLMATVEASFSKTRTRGAALGEEKGDDEEVAIVVVRSSSFGPITALAASARGFAVPATRAEARWESPPDIGEVAAALRAERARSWGIV